MAEMSKPKKAPAPATGSVRLPPTSTDLLIDSTRPYFLWWTEATVGDLKRHMSSGDPEERACWLGALLREANSRDVVLFTDRDEILATWPRLIRYLGRSREMWAWALGLRSRMASCRSQGFGRGAKAS
jgi:hypothetical protein